MATGNRFTFYLKKIIRKSRFILTYIWVKSLDVFKFLPIRFKLSLIIGSIVIIVVMVFSLILLQRQKSALRSRMIEVSEILVKNFAEPLKDDLLLGKHDNVQVAVNKLKNSHVEGLQQIHVVNHRGKLAATTNTHLSQKNVLDIIQFQERDFIEKPSLFEFYYPLYMPVDQGPAKNNKFLGTVYVSFSKNAILAPFRQARDIAFGSALLVTFLSIIGIYIVARKMAFQIQQLSRGAREVGNGNLNIEIAVNSKDELGLLAKEFNNMIHHLREKLQMQKFVSKLTVQMIQDTAHKTEKNVVAVKRNVAILFSDVRNFSSVAEKLAPEEIVKLINVYFGLQTRIIENHHGIVDKFMGDQIMAIFEGHNMADSALRAAVEIQKQIRLLNQDRKAMHKVILEMGIGINNGAIVMGHMGSSHRMDYTVIGDVVNVAARLCAAAKAGQIITSLELARRVNGSYPTTRLKSISVKGRIKSIDVCEVDYDRDILM